MVFNSTGRLLKSTTKFKLGDKLIENTRTYCYLGITFSLNGSFKVAQDELRKKALRSYFSLKKTIDVNSLSVKAVLMLFDSLVLPVLSYGIQAWFCNTNIAAILSGQISYSVKGISQDCLEKIHVQIIKWTLGVHKRASNIGCYGEAGRVPLGVKCLPQVLRYFLHLEATSENLNQFNASEIPLSTLAFLEQKKLGMKWYSTLKDICIRQSDVQHSNMLSAEAIKQNCCKEFVKFWNSELSTRSKLGFYRSVKSEFGYEEYLSLLPRILRMPVTKLRISAHNLNCEKGRYNNNSGNDRLLLKTCSFCMADDAPSTLLHELPFYAPIVEDELHVLVTCPKYNLPRSKLPQVVLSHLLRHELSELFRLRQFTFYLGQYVKSIFEMKSKTLKAKIQ